MGFGRGKGFSPVPPPAPPAGITPWTFNSIEPQLRNAGGVDEWKTVSLAHCIPVGATGAIIHLVNTDPGEDRKVGLRKPGDTHIQQGRMYRASHTWGIVGVDAALNFEFFADGPLAPVDIWIMGWTGPNVHFLDTSVEYNPPNLAWTDLDCSPHAPGALAAIWDISHQGYAWRSYAIRKKGSTDNHYADIGHNWPIIGLDATQKCQGYFESLTVTRLRAFLTGYITAGVKMRTNAPDVSPAILNSWEDYVLPLANTTVRWGIFEMTSPQVFYYWGGRKNHSKRSIHPGSSRHEWAFVHCDGGKKVELYRQDNTVKIYQVGAVA
ncbi:hypothetical protein ES708_01450 [subsurface metagenome]